MELSPPPVQNILEYSQPVPSVQPDQKGFDSSNASSSGAACKPRALRALRAVVLAATIVLVLVLLFYMISPRTLAKRLSRRGWTVYYRQDCGFCTEQKLVLKGKFHKFIECDVGGRQVRGYTASPPLSCGSDAITGYPFWYNTRTKETRSGLQDVDALEKMARGK